MDQTILKQLQEINKKLETMLTRDDAKSFLTKGDAEKFVTKDDLKNAFATYPTKSDLKILLDKQTEAICDDIGKTVTELFTEADKRIIKLKRRAKLN